LAPCGMFTFDPEGTITWANPQWYEMTGHSRDPDQHYPMSILNCIEQQDHAAFHDQWRRLTVAKEEVTSELRLKKPWIRQESNEPVRDTTWILFLALPQLDDEGNLTKVLGCTTDISHFKWGESVQLHSRLQAEEAKRQQETFIDMTSHEMRNPLSAIMLCADGIANSLIEFQSLKAENKVISQSLVESNLDAAQTIVLCAQHQKRIIDDVLTLSKLNSAMLHVAPIQIQLESTVRRTLKMFEGELQADGIKMTFVLEPSYHESQIDWVFCDPVRLTQIFINLLTNAIKFTRAENRREIMVSLGASISRPPKESAPHIQWFPSKDSSSHHDLTLGADWGFGPQVYLYFAVKDTGRGLSEDEKTRLFHRFSQASPRTHVQYGGSGLGLFISRELTELQGG
jgi:signal transduction histidine kinase